MALHQGTTDGRAGGDTEILVVRLADGAVLATSTGTYWNTGEARANRLEELATWSPNSRLLIRSFNSRFSTDNVDLYAFGANDEATGPFDLLKVIDPAIRAHLRRRVKDEQKYVFSTSNEPAMSIGNSGLVRAAVMMWVPKDGPERNSTVTVRVTRSKVARRAHRVRCAVARAAVVLKRVRRQFAGRSGKLTGRRLTAMPQSCRPN